MKLGESNFPKKQTASRKNLTGKVLEILSSREILNSIISVLATKISESVSSMVESQVLERVEAATKHLLEQIETQTTNSGT